VPDNSEAYLHMIAYKEVAPSFEQAEEMAKNTTLSLLSPHAVVARSNFVTRKWKVVWFRSLTAEEEAYLDQ
jgi:hypothetical protein